MNSPSKCRQFLYASTLAVASVLAFATTTHAQILYSDSYSTGTNNTTLVGRTPDTDLTGATYVGRARGQTIPNSNTTVGNPPGSANTGANGAAALSLATGGSFTRVANASTFTISADLSIGGTTGSGTAANAGTSTRGVELGFYGAPFVGGGQGTNDANELFTGFALQNGGSSTGILQLVTAGVSTGKTTLTVLSGNLSTAAFYNLTYTVSTATGNLLSASFNGVDITSSFTGSAAGAFTDAATAFAGFGASSTTGGTNGEVDNFTVTAVPEPGTWATALVGLGALLGVRRFRTRKA